MSVTVISYNIRRINHEEKTNPRHWNFRKEKVAETIMKFNPDIIALQECYYTQSCDLHKLLPDYYQPIFLSFCFQDTILYDSRRFKPCLSLVLFLRPLYRFAYKVKFYDKETGKKLYFCNLHLDPGYENIHADNRRYSVNRILKSFKKANDSHPVIVLGDFNSLWSEEAYQIMAGILPCDIGISYMKDTYPLPTYAYTQLPLTTESNRNDWQDLADTTARIDHIFTNNKLHVMDTTTTWSPDTEQWKYTGTDGLKRYASDHLGVVAELEYV